MEVRIYIILGELRHSCRRFEHICILAHLQTGPLQSLKFLVRLDDIEDCRVVASNFY